MIRFKNNNGHYNLLSDEELNNMYHVVSFSGGRTSAYLLHKLVSIIPKEKLIVNFANTGREDENTLLFVKQNQEYLGIDINWLEFEVNEKGQRGFKIVNYETASRDGTPLKTAIKFCKFVPNIMMRMCTIISKIDTMKEFMKSKGLTLDKYVTYIGIRHDEPRRWSKNINQFGTDGTIMSYPLVDWVVSKKDVLEFWNNMPFNLKVNEPYGNCDLCFLKSTKKRIHILKEHPEVAEFWRGIEIEMKNNFDRQYSVNQLYKLANGKGMLDPNKEQKNDIECNCNID